MKASNMPQVLTVVDPLIYEIANHAVLVYQITKLPDGTWELAVNDNRDNSKNYPLKFDGNKFQTWQGSTNYKTHNYNKFAFAGDNAVNISADLESIYNYYGPHSISGTVTLNGVGLPGVTVSGVGITSIITDANGKYTFAKVANGTYSMTAAKTGYTIAPSNIPITLNGVDATSLDFTASAIPVTYSLSGTIRVASNTGAVLSGATVSIADKTTITDSSGTFTISGIPSGPYTVSVSKTGYDSYTSPAIAVSSDLTALNYLLQGGYSLSGTVHSVNNTGPGLAGATLWIAGKKVITGVSGTFTVTGIPAGIYTLSVSKSGYDTYANTKYNVSSTQTNLNFYLIIANSSLACPSIIGTSINGIQFNGAPHYSISSIQTTKLTWGAYYQNANNLPAGISGSLRARLWAVPYSFAGGNINAYVLGAFIPNFTGTGAYSSNQLYVNGFTLPSVTNSITGPSPSSIPTGMYCILATIEEYNPSTCTEQDGYCYDQWFQFDGAMGFL